MAGGEGSRAGIRRGGWFARSGARDPSAREPEVQAAGLQPGEATPGAMLDVRDLHIHFATDDGLV